MDAGCSVYCAAFVSCLLKSAGTVNASGPAALVDTETNCDEMVINATSPGGTAAGGPVGADCAAGVSASSFFLWKRPPSLPAIAPARPDGLLELSLSELDCACWALEFLQCWPPRARVKLLLTGYPVTPCILVATSHQMPL